MTNITHVPLPDDLDHVPTLWLAQQLLWRLTEEKYAEGKDTYDALCGKLSNHMLTHNFRKQQVTEPQP